MEDKTEYRFSWTVKPSEGEFRTSRGDSVDEVMKGMDELEQRIALREKPIVSQPSVKIEPSDITGSTTLHFCQEHQKEWKKREKNGKIFYSHSIGTYPNFTGWCNEKE